MLPILFIFWSNSRIILTIIGISLVGLLVKQLPEKMEANPEYSVLRIKVISLDYKDLKNNLNILVNLDKEKPFLRLYPGDRDLAEKVATSPSPSRDMLLEYVLAFEYALGYRVKFVTDDFIILESE